jgi:hypothetical protein
MKKTTKKTTIEIKSFEKCLRDILAEKTIDLRWFDQEEVRMAAYHSSKEYYDWLIRREQLSNELSSSADDDNDSTKHTSKSSFHGAHVGSGSGHKHGNNGH